MNKFYVIVTPFFPSPTSWRGAYCFDFAKALTKHFERKLCSDGESWKVLVFVPGAGEDYEIDGMKVYRFATRHLPSNIFPFFFRRYNERSFLNKVKEVLCSIVDIRLQPTPDIFSRVSVCHGHIAHSLIYPLAIKKLNPNCKTLLHHHDPQSFGMGLGILAHNWLYQIIEFPIVRHLHEQIDCHVFISEMVKRSFLSAPDASWTNYDDYRRQMRGPKIFRRRPVRIKRSFILHNGVDTTIFQPLPQPQPPISIFTIGCIGNFLDWKDQETLIRAVEILTQRHRGAEIKCIFVGSGPLLQRCKELANSIVSPNLQPQPIFEFRTEVQHKQLASFYHSINLFVLPSYFEGFGCVFTEAYASGVPFITCEGQGMEDMVRDDDKMLFFCKIANPTDLANKIDYYMGERPVLHLKSAYAFEDLIPTFIREVEAL